MLYRYAAYRHRLVGSERSESSKRKMSHPLSYPRRATGPFRVIGLPSVFGLEQVQFLSLPLSDIFHDPLQKEEPRQLYLVSRNARLKHKLYASNMTLLMTSEGSHMSEQRSCLKDMMTRLKKNSNRCSHLSVCPDTKPRRFAFLRRLAIIYFWNSIGNMFRPAGPPGRDDSFWSRDLTQNEHLRTVIERKQKHGRVRLRLRQQSSHLC